MVLATAPSPKLFAASSTTRCSVVQAVAESEGYRRIVYSAADGSGQLGTGIFDVGDDVRAYIVERLRGLENESFAADGS